MAHADGLLSYTERQLNSRKQSVGSRKRDVTDTDSQTMRCNYRRGIVLSGFSLAVVTASKVVDGLRLRWVATSRLTAHSSYRALPNVIVGTLMPHLCVLAPLLNTLLLASYTHRLVTFPPHLLISLCGSLHDPLCIQ